MNRRTLQIEVFCPHLGNEKSGVSKPMVCVRVAFHENDGNHENDENDEDCA